MEKDIIIIDKETKEEINLTQNLEEFLFINGYELKENKLAIDIASGDEEEYDEDKEARDYEGGKEDYLYDNFVADQLESEGK
tara:strand:- start:302 stop:547 length:246 start_codon:yes stop_codon:yes gene_type:complete